MTWRLSDAPRQTHHEPQCSTFQSDQRRILTSQTPDNQISLRELAFGRAQKADALLQVAQPLLASPHLQEAPEAMRHTRVQMNLGLRPGMLPEKLLPQEPLVAQRISTADLKVHAPGKTGVIPVEQEGDTWIVGW